MEDPAVFVAHVQSMLHGGALACAVCRGSAWHLAPPAMVPGNIPGTLTPTGTQMRVVALMCERCGYLMFFSSAMVFGQLEKPEPPAGPPKLRLVT